MRLKRRLKTPPRNVGVGEAPCAFGLEGIAFKFFSCLKKYSVSLTF